MKLITAKKIKSIQQFSILLYKENRVRYGVSKTPENIANSLMKEYENVIIENDLVIGYYKNGFKYLPVMLKY